MEMSQPEKAREKARYNYVQLVIRGRACKYFNVDLTLASGCPKLQFFFNLDLTSTWHLDGALAKLLYSRCQSHRFGPILIFFEKRHFLFHRLDTRLILIFSMPNVMSIFKFSIADINVDTISTKRERKAPKRSKGQIGVKLCKVVMWILFFNFVQRIMFAFGAEAVPIDKSGTFADPLIRGI